MGHQLDRPNDLGLLLLDLNQSLVVTAEELARTNYEKFLGVLRTGEHPPFCELVWTGKIFVIVLLVHFQKGAEHDKPPAHVSREVREHACAHFSEIPTSQQRFVHIRVFVRNWLPQTAEITVRPEETRS